jgi:hypothetical protein
MYLPSGEAFFGGAQVLKRLPDMQSFPDRVHKAIKCNQEPAHQPVTSLFDFTGECSDVT